MLGKRGVGLIVRFDEPVSIGTLQVTSSSTNWTASIYLTEGDPGADLGSWGETVTTGEVSAPSASFAVDGAARAVLIWITRMGDDGRVDIAEVQASG